MQSRTIIEVMEARSLFQRWFTGSSWDAWRSFLKVLFGLPLSKTDAVTYREHTQRSKLPTQPFSECWVVAGRRGGKSLIASLVATYLAAFVDYRRYLQRGEYGVVAVVAADRKQARVCLRYIRAFLNELPMLKRMVVNETADSITLSNRVIIEIHTASWRSIRGYTLLACVCDEVAYWRSDESANPDREVLSAVRPGLATIPSSLLLCISSPYARRGSLWDAYSKHFAKDDDATLVWQAPSRSMNPSLRQSVVDRAMEEDESQPVRNTSHSSAVTWKATSMPS